MLCALSIKALERSRSRVRRMLKSLPDWNFGQNEVIDAHRRMSRNHLRHLPSGAIRSSSG
jgi:hypothetical protein